MSGQDIKLKYTASPNGSISGIDEINNWHTYGHTEIFLSKIISINLTSIPRPKGNIVIIKTIAKHNLNSKLNQKVTNYSQSKYSPSNFKQ